MIVVNTMRQSCRMKYFNWYDWFSVIGGFIILWFLSKPLLLILIIWIMWMYYMGYGCFNERTNALWLAAKKEKRIK